MHLSRDTWICQIQNHPLLRVESQKIASLRHRNSRQTRLRRLFYLQLFVLLTSTPGVVCSPCQYEVGSWSVAQMEMDHRGQQVSHWQLRKLQIRTIEALTFCCCCSQMLVNSELMVLSWQRWHWLHWGRQKQIDCYRSVPTALSFTMCSEQADGVARQL